MKQSPDMEKLDSMLRSSHIVVGGFLGDDPRGVDEIIAADLAELERLGYTKEQVGARMLFLSEHARSGLGSYVDIEDDLEVMADDNRGQIVCPWPHDVRCFKTVTTAKRRESGRTVCWSDLCMHLILEHGFFQGRGSQFRLEPQELITVLF